MKKTPRKLVLRSETLRTLRTLPTIDIVRAVGGVDSGAATCPNLAAGDSSPAVCSTDAPATATTACP